MRPCLGIDYHHRLSVAEAASFCQMLPPATLDFLEEPIRDECPDAYAALRQMTPIPFAIGEEFSSKWAFLPYVERGLTNFARVDICNVGGFSEAMKIAGWCEAHYIDLMPHNPSGAHLHGSQHPSGRSSAQLSPGWRCAPARPASTSMPRCSPCSRD